MGRRGFLKVLGAMAAGIVLRPVPVLGEHYSELTVPQSFASIAQISSGLTVVTDPNWVPVTTRMLADDDFLRGMRELRVTSLAHWISPQRADITSVEGIHGLLNQRILLGLDLAQERGVFTP